MDEALRDRLRQRRELNQLRLRRARDSAQFRRLSPLLCSAGVKFSKIPVVAIEPLLAHLAGAELRDERIYWPSQAHGECLYWDTLEECAGVLDHVLGALATPDERVAVISHPCDCGLAIRAGALANVWRQVHRQYYDAVWIVPFSPSGWVIEISFIDHEICHAKDLSPSGKSVMVHRNVVERSTTGDSP